MSDSASLFRRLLALLPLLADEEPHALDDVARAVGATADDVLAEFFALGDRPDDPAGFVASLTLEVEAAPPARVRARSPHLKRPMRLAWSERQALELGLAALALERPAADRAAFARARAALARLSVPTSPGEVAEERRRLSAYRDTDVAVLRLLQQAARERRVVRIAYQRVEAEAPAERQVHPYAVMLARGTWYCPAWCASAGALRIFRLDRIVSAEAGEAHFERPDDFDPQALVTDGRVFQHEGAEVMTVRYGPRIARWIAEREGRAPAPDGSVTLDLPLADDAWAIRHVLQYGPDAEILAPERLREGMRQVLRRMARGR